MNWKKVLSLILSFSMMLSLATPAYALEPADDYVEEIEESYDEPVEVVTADEPSAEPEEIPAELPDDDPVEPPEDGEEDFDFEVQNVGGGEDGDVSEDDDAPDFPTANVVQVTPPAKRVPVKTLAGMAQPAYTQVTDLGVEYVFTAVQPTDEQLEYFSGWNADYRVTFSADMAKESFGLYGKYASYEGAFLFPENVTAGQSYFLLQAALGDNSFTYSDVLNFVKTFDCGAFNLNEANVGNTMTVDLVMWKDGATQVIGTRTYTFGEPTTVRPAVPAYPEAEVTQITPPAKNVPVKPIDGIMGDSYSQIVDLGAEYRFAMVEPSEDQIAYYGDWFCDYRVSFNKPLEANSFGLYGKYGEYEGAFLIPMDVEAGTEYYLLKTAAGVSNFTYNDVRQFVQVFDCGVFNLSEANRNAGKVMKVDLVMWTDGVDPVVIATRTYSFDDLAELHNTTYTVKFDSDGGTAVAAQTVPYNGKAEEPAVPEKEHYVFMGWTLKGAAYDFDTAVTADITLKAQWMYCVAKIGDTPYGSVADAVAASKAGDTVEILVAGAYTLPNLPNNITVEGTVDGVVFNHTSGGNIAAIPNGATFKNVTFNFGNVDFHGFQHAGTINMDGCTLNGRLSSYGDMNFTGCTFNAPGTGASGITSKDYSMWAYAGNLTYTDCVFNGAGKFLNVYNESGATRYEVTATRCVFNSTVSNKAAFNVKETCTNGNVLKYTVNLNDCTVSGNFPAASESDVLTVISGLVQVDDRVVGGTENGGEIVVNVDGEQVYITPKIVMVAAIGETEYASLQAALDAAQAMGGNVTIDVYAGEVELPATAVIPEGVTIKGAATGDTTLKITTGTGSGVKLTNPNVTIKDVTIDGSAITSVGYNTIVNVRADGCVIDNVVFTGGGTATWNSSILIETLPSTATFTVRNSAITDTFRGVLRESCSANIVIENCEIDAVYPFNIDGGSGGTISVTGSKLHGWTSYSGVEKVTFTDCEFSKGNRGYDVVAAYVNTDFNNCTFDSEFDIYAQTSPFVFNVDDCTKDGAAVTRDSFTSQFTDSDVWVKCSTYVNGKLVGAVAEVTDGTDTAEFKSLQAALDAAHEMTGDVTVTLVADITEVAVVHQKAGLNLTVDGAGKTITGQINIDGDGRYNGTDTLTIQNVKFAYDADTYADAFVCVAKKSSGYNYAHNITVRNCEFAGEGTTTVAFRVASGAGAHGVVLDALTVTGGHSFAQLTGVKDLTITGCTVTGTKNGINISGGEGTGTIFGNTIVDQGYTVRVKDASGMAVTLSDNTFSGDEGLVSEATFGGKITVESGKYAGPLPTDPAKFTVNGGIFSVMPDPAVCGEGLYPVANTDEATKADYPYAVGEAVASVDGVGYLTFAEAVTAANNGEKVITLLANISDPYELALDETLKVNKNGKSLTVKAPEGPYVLKSLSSGGVTTYTVVEADLEYTNANGVTSYKAWSNTVISANGTYKLLKDITATARITPGALASNVTLDLNGHTITSTANDCAILLTRVGTANAHKTFAIIDSSEGQGGRIEVNPNAKLGIDVQGKYNDVTIGEGVTINGNCVLLESENQTLNVNGTVNGGSNFAVVTNGDKTKNATININSSAVLTSDGVAVYLPGTGTTTISGTVTGTTAVYQKSGTLNIVGATLTATGAAAPYTYYANGCYSTGDALVVDSCDYPGGAPVTNITGAVISSANNKEVAAYMGNGVTALSYVKADTDTLTIPDNEVWFEEDGGGFRLGEGFTVTFDPANGEAVTVVKIEKGLAVDKPADPELEHYDFLGWFAGESETAYDFDAVVTENMTLTAKWSIEKIFVAYTNGMGNVYARYEVDYGTDTPVYALTGELPTRPGFHLDENNLWVPAVAEKATEDVIYVLNWITDTPVPTATVVQVTPPAKDVPVKTLEGLTQDEYNQVVDLGVEYVFTAVEPTAEQLEYFGDWNADYRVTFSKALAAESFGLYGKYGEYEGAFLYPAAVAAGEEVYLLQAAFGEGYTFTYNDVLTFVKVFDCGAFNLSEDNQDATMTVELVIWKDGVSEPIVIKSRTYGFDDLTEVRDVVPDMPTATVSRILPPKQDVPVKTLEGLTGDDYDQVVNLGVEYKFTAVEPTAKQLAYYGNWNADYRVTFSAPMAAESFGLYGQYGEYEGAFLFPTDVAAGEEVYLLQAALGEGYTFTYNDVLNFVKVFDCGAFNLSADNRNAALMTVELVIWTDGVDPIVISSETYGFEDLTTVRDVIPALPTATVEQVEPAAKDVPVKTVAGLTGDDYDQIVDLGVEYKFTAVEPTAEQLAYYSGWNCDYRVTFDQALAAESFGLYGQYGEYEGAFLFPKDVAAGEEVYLLQAAFGEGYTFTYNDVLNFVKVFDCGAFNLSADNQDATMTVELVMWTDGEEPVVIASETYGFDDLTELHNTSYTVTFDSDGGTAVDAQTVAYKDKAEEPAAPEKEHYVFSGWTLDGAAYDFTAEVTGDITLKAVWVAEEYTVTFDSDGGTAVDAQTVTYKDKATEPTAPEKEHYDFSGWTLDGAAYDFTAEVTADITLKAVWTPVDYTVTFDSDGGTAVDAQTVTYNEKATEPAAPEKEHCIFEGWTLDGADFDFDTPITGDITLKAKWGNEKVLVAYTDGMGQVLVKFEADYGTDTPVYTFTGALPAREGFHLDENNLWVPAIAEKATEDVIYVLNWITDTPVPTAAAVQITPPAKDVPVKTLDGLTQDAYNQVVDLGVEYLFTAMEPTDEQLAYFGDWNADYRVTFSKALAAESFGLYGKYGEYEGAFLFPKDVAAGEEVYLLQAALGDSSFTYNDVLTFVKVFDCGAFNLSADNQDATMTVELVIWKDGVSEPIVIKSRTYGFDDLTEVRDVVPDMPTATVSRILPPKQDVPVKTLEGLMGDDYDQIVNLGVEYKFTAVEPTAEQLAYYGGWNADYRVTFSAPMAAESFGLYGQYGEYEGAFLFPKAVAAGEEVYLLQAALGEGYTFTYNDVLNFVKVFDCGAFNLSADNRNAALMTVELVMWTDGVDPIVISSETYGFEDLTTVRDVIPALPTATVEQVEPAAKDVPVKTVAGLTGDDYDQIVDLGVEYKFTAVEPTAEQLAYYSGWNCDYRVTFDQALAKESFGLYGQYGEYEGAFLFPTDVAAGQSVYLLQAAFGEGYTFTYNDVLTFVKVFDCGAFNLSADNQDATMTVELVMWTDGAEPVVIASETYGFDDLTELHNTSYTVTFDSDGGTAVGAQTVAYKDKAEEPAAPEKEHYDFAGWTLDGAAYDFDTEVTADITLKASWTPVDYTVTFDSDGGTAVDAQTVTYKDKAAEPTAPEKEHYDFAGWTLDGAAYDFGTEVTADITLKAIWTPVDYTITFIIDDDTIKTTQTYGDPLVAPEVPPKPTQVFTGWEPALTETVEGAKVYTATWAGEEKTVVYANGMGGVLQKNVVRYGDAMPQFDNTIELPTRTGYRLDPNNLWTPAVTAQTVKVDVVYELNWIKQLTVTFLVDEELYGELIILDDGAAVGADRMPEKPTKEGYDFVGWFIGENAFDPTEPVHSNTTVEAKWQAQKRTVTFDANGGSAVAPAVVDYGTPVAKPADPVKEYSICTGWTLNGEPYDFAAPVTGNITLVAVWTEDRAALVDAMIEAIGEVTLESEEAINAAREAYEALTDAEKERVTKLDVLEAAEAKLAALKVEDLINKIDDDPVTLASEEGIVAARAAYDALTDAEKALVSEEAVAKLEAAEAALAALKAAAAAVDALIEAIPQPITRESFDEIRAARDAYNALSDELKPLVTKTAVLEQSEADSAALVQDMIDAIEEPVTLASAGAIKDARDAYNELTEEAKALVDPSRLDRLARLEEELEKLRGESDLVDGIRLSHEYIILNEDETLQLTVLDIEELGDVEITWSVENDKNEKYDGDPIITVDDNGLVTALSPVRLENGKLVTTAYVKATALGTDGMYRYARCRVDVMAREIQADLNAYDVRMIDTKAKVPLYSTNYVGVRLQITLLQDIITTMADGEPDVEETEPETAAIDSAFFASREVAQLFDLRVKDDRTLEIIPKSEIVTTDKATLKTIKSSYKSAITIMIDGKPYTTVKPLTLSVDKKMPKVTVKAGKLNSLLEDVKPLTVKGGVIESFSTTNPVPWLTIDEDEMAVVYNFGENNAYRGLKQSAKLSLQVRLKGWALPVDVKFTVSAAPIKPKVTFSPKTLTLKPNFEDEASTAWTIKPEVYAEDEVFISKITEGKAGSAAPEQATEFSAYGLICELDDGRLVVRTGEGFNDTKARTFKVYLNVDGFEYPVTVKTLKQAATVTMTLKASGSINLNVVQSPVKITATTRNFNTPTVEEFAITKIVAAKTVDPDLREKFEIEQDGNVFTLTAGEGLQPGTYTVTVVALNEAGTALAEKTVNIKVTQPAKPSNASLTLKAKGSIDVLRPGFTSVTLTPTFKNCFIHELDKVVITSGKGDVTDSFTWDETEDGRIVITIADGAKVSHADKYTVTVTYRINDSDATVSNAKPIKLNVKQGKSAVAISSKKVMLFKNDRFSTGEVKIRITDPTLTGIKDIKFVSPKVKGVEVLELRDLGNGVYAIAFKDNTPPRADWKYKGGTAKIQVFLEGNETAKPNTTFSVRVNVK